MGDVFTKSGDLGTICIGHGEEPTLIPDAS